MGEGIGPHAFGNDATLMSNIHAANIACGFHAGDPSIMAETIALAKANNVQVGAHPGLPDLVGFGRRRLAVTPQEVGEMIRYQVGALTGFLGDAGLRLSHIKAHGSLAGMLAEDVRLMREVARVNQQYDAPFFGFGGGTAHETVCQEMGVEFVPELYVDLNYGSDGSLIIQRHPEQVDPAAVVDRLRRALSGRPIIAKDGTEIKINFRSICVHSDPPNSPEISTIVRNSLSEFYDS